MKVAARFAPLRLLGVESGRPRWPTLTLCGDGLTLRPPDIDDFIAWAELREASRSFLTPWEPRWPEDDLTRSAFRRRIKRYHQEIDRDEAYPFFVFREEDDTLLGGLTLGNVRRGAAQTVTLGYWMGQRHAGQHVMSRAVGLACRHAFRGLGLQRIEAACLPQNDPSIRLLENAGFQKEGYARSYLNIDGQRRDHLLFALLANDFAASVNDPRRR